MSTVAEIKVAVAKLSLSERAEFAKWFNGWEDDEWDKQMVKDFSPGGRGMAWVAKVKRDLAEGQARPLEEGQAEAKARREQLQSQQ